MATNETPIKAPTTKVFFQRFTASMLLIGEAALEDDDDEVSVELEAPDSSDDLLVFEPAVPDEALDEFDSDDEEPETADSVERAEELSVGPADSPVELPEDSSVDPDSSLPSVETVLVAAEDPSLPVNESTRAAPPLVTTEN